jgi:predicted phage terminase large subunit-like protein
MSETALALISEVQARREARKSLAAWVKYRKAAFVPAEHHKLMIAELERIESGANDRLMFLLPPGSAKSTYGSVEFPTWYMGRNPGNSVIAASNTTDLAERFSRRVRNLCSERNFRDVFGCGVSEDYAGAGKWETDLGGEYYAAGVGAAIAGRRADLAIIDDPTKSREDADSERSREKQWEWYVNDLLTRLKPDAAIILIMTRWHEDDLGGRILERERERWKVIKIPMEAEEDDPLGREVGERLWKEWYTESMIELAKQDTRSWWALYQQNPHSEEGDYFKTDWLIDYDSVPKGLHIYGASDFAVTDGTGDYTEHGIAGVDASGNMYLLDWWRGQKSADVWIDKMADMINRWQPQCWFGEAGPIRRSVEPFMMKRLSERNAFCRVEWLTSIHDKESRARGIQAFMAMGKMFWPKFSGWKADVQGQLLKFPSGKHDDAVDVISLFGRGLKFINSSKPLAKKITYRNLGLPGRM